MSVAFIFDRRWHGSKVQFNFDRINKLREIAKYAKALKTKRAAIRAANAALLPATLERVFAQESQGDDRG